VEKLNPGQREKWSTKYEDRMIRCVENVCAQTNKTSVRYKMPAFAAVRDLWCAPGGQTNKTSVRDKMPAFTAVRDLWCVPVWPNGAARVYRIILKCMSEGSEDDDWIDESYTVK
jgi:hypothetical protein